jgi:hypothetical protein
MAERKTTKNRPPFEKGWDAGNQTWDGVYAIKKGNKIFANTGIIHFLGETTKENEDYRTGGASATEFERLQKKHTKDREILIHTEKGKTYGALKRLMIRVV